MGLVFIKIMRALCVQWNSQGLGTQLAQDSLLAHLISRCKVCHHSHPRREHNVPFDWLDSKSVFPSFLLVHSPRNHQSEPAQSERNQLSQSSK